MGVSGKGDTQKGMFGLGLFFQAYFRVCSPTTGGGTESFGISRVGLGFPVWGLMGSITITWGLGWGLCFFFLFQSFESREI